MNVNKRSEKDCPTCGNHFVCVKPEQRFCSKKCIRTGRNHHVCPCGVNTGSYQKKYCSPEHREQYGKKKAPTRMVEHVCQNPACGKTFERPVWYPNKKMFCSLKCSNEQHSRKRARHYQFGELNLNGSYELRFVACLERLNIRWSPWPDDKPFVTTDGHEYRPDFLVDGCAIEVKGWDKNGQAERRIAWDYNEPLILVDLAKLARLEHLHGQHAFLDDLGS